MPTDLPDTTLPDARPLVLCADDYAVHASASVGILALARRARLSATSVMVLSARWPEDAAPLRELQGRIDVGLHLDFTSPMALAAGHGRSLGALMLRTQWPLSETLCEQWRRAIEAQCDAFEQHWRAVPDHVDGHQHVQQFGGLREVLLQVLTRRYPERTPWLRVSRVAQDDLKSHIISGWGAAQWQRQLQRGGWHGVSPLRGAYGFEGGQAAYAARMRHWLAQARLDGGLIMCHPARAVEPADPIGAARHWEYAYLSDDAFVHDLAAAGVRLTRGGALHS